MLLSTALLLVTTALAQSPSPILQTRQSPGLCNQSDIWTPDVQEYIADNTDQNLAAIWSKSQSEGQRFDHALGEIFGYDEFKCGIGFDSSCIAPNCFAIETEGDSSDPWLLQAGESVQNMNTMLKVMYDGIETGQSDAGLLSNDLADRFFHWKDPIYLGNDVAAWVGATITIIVSVLTPGVDEEAGPEAAAWLVALAEFGSQVANQVSNSFQPLAGLDRNSGIDALNDLFYQLASAARESLDTFANSAFAGQPTRSGKTILDYLRNGGFVNDNRVPSATAVEQFYKSSLIGRAINAKWRSQTAYVVATSASMSADDDFPSNDSWTDPQTGMTFVPYYFDGKAQQELPDIDALNNGLYNIRASQVAQASGRAWEYAGLNYTSQDASTRILASFTNSSLNPWQDGVAWEGTFTLPVCDVGSHSEWIVPYGGGALPCCCGEACSQTGAFVQAANLHTSEDFLDICRNQLQNTDLDFDSIDYGIDAGSAIHQWWHRLGKGGKAGVVIGGVVGFLGRLRFVVGLLLLK